MYKISLIFLTSILSWMSVCAQNTNTTWESWNRLFDHITAGTCQKTGILWNMGLADSAILQYERSRHPVSSDFNGFSDVYQYWSGSLYDPSQLPLPYDQLIRELSKEQALGISCLAALRLDGEMIKPEQFQSGEVYLDSSVQKLKCKNYCTAISRLDVFSAAPFVSTCFDGIFRLKISNRYFFTNRNVKISRAFGAIDGKSVGEITLDKTFELELINGQHLFDVQLVLSDGEELTSTFNVLVSQKVKAATPYSELQAIGDSKGDIYVKSVRDTEFGEMPGANVRVMPGSDGGIAHTCIRKPLIFVEGIDFGYKDHMTGCYGGKCGNIGLDDLLRGQVFDPYETNSQKAYSDWAPIGKAPELIKRITDAGYDFVYLDFHNGADFMENNSALLVELIRKINTIKCSNEEIVIVGASMGGQICRYALTWMEQQKIPHCVRLFVDFDSPNEGANIPPGLQHFMKYFSGKLPTVKDHFKRKLDRPATKQLLNYHCESGGIEHVLRSEFVSQLEKQGSYPVYCRKVALLNGSVEANYQDFTEGEKLLELNPYVGASMFQPLRFTSVVWATYLKDNNRNLVGSASVPFNNSYWEVPEQTPKTDHVPGSGRFDLAEAEKIYLIMNLIARHDQSCFIPSSSALGVKMGHHTDDLFSKYPFNERSIDHPFDAYFGPRGENQEHVMLTGDNIAWMMSQLEMNKNDLSATLTTNYNFGLISRKVIGNVKVEKGGALRVNQHGISGYGTDPFDQPIDVDSVFRLRTSQCGSEIDVRDGGVLEIGEYMKSVAEVNVLPGSKVMLNNNGTLIVNNGSRLIIHEGAELIYQKGARIILNGEDASLVLKGKLVLSNGAVFRVIHAVGKPGTFHVVNRSLKNPNVVVTGSASVDLTGIDAYRPLNLKIEGAFDFGSIPGLSMFSLNFVKVSYAENSTLKLNSAASFKNVVFVPLVASKNIGIKAVDLTGSVIAEFNNCEFFQIPTGVVSQGNLMQVLLKSCQFNLCNTAISNGAGRIDLLNCSFSKCEKAGLDMTDREMSVLLKSCLFSKCGTAILDRGTKVNSVLYSEDCSIEQNTMGLQLRGTKAIFQCSRFIKNETALSMDGGLLNLSPNMSSYFREMYLNGGNCTFLHEYGDAVVLRNTTVYLENGANNFIYTGKSSQYKHFKGSLAFESIVNISGQLAMKANSNYWEPKFSQPLSGMSQTAYDLETRLPNGQIRTCSLDGAMLKQYNSKCFNYSGCNPCEITRNSDLPSVNNTDTPQTIRIYPNPVNHSLSVQGNVSDVIKVVLIDQSGREIVMLNSLELLENIDLSWLASGYYCLLVQSQSRTSRAYFMKE